MLDKEFDEIAFGLKTQYFFMLSPYCFCSFRVYGKKWRTLVHFWSANYFMGDDFMVDWIRNQDTPQMAINCAKKRGFKDFNQVDSKVFIQGVQERFNQDDSARMALLSTGNVTLIYKGGSKDSYLCKNNLYGRVLMRVREMYNEDT